MHFITVGVKLVFFLKSLILFTVYCKHLNNKQVLKKYKKVALLQDTGFLSNIM